MEVKAMNETIKNMIERRSIRKYTSEPVPQEIIDEIVEAGTYAATGRNAQSPIIIEVTNKELRDRLSALNAKIMGKEEGFDPFYGANTVLIVLADKSNLRIFMTALLLWEILCLLPIRLELVAVGFIEQKKNLRCQRVRKFLNSLA